MEHFEILSSNRTLFFTYWTLRPLGEHNLHQVLFESYQIVGGISVT
jgi:hypothetical protein